MSRVRTRIKRVSGTAIPVIALAAVVPIVWRHSAELRHYHWTISPSLLAASYLALFTAFLLVVFVWLLLLRRFGLSLTYKRAFEIWYISNLGRYLPGKIWSLVGMIYLCEQEGLPRGKLIASGIVTQIFSISAAFVLGFIYLPSATSLKSRALAIPALSIVLGALLLIVLVPNVCVRCMGSLARKLRVHEIASALRPVDRVVFIGLNILCWLIYGTAFGLFVLSISNFPATHFLSLIPTFALAYTLGFLALFAPSGFGVREGVIALLLSPFFPLPLALAIALAARFWFTVGEVIFFLIAWLLQIGIYAQIHATVYRAVTMVRPSFRSERQSSASLVHTTAVARSCNGSEYSSSDRET